MLLWRHGTSDTVLRLRCYCHLLLHSWGPCGDYVRAFPPLVGVASQHAVMFDDLDRCAQLLAHRRPTLLPSDPSDPADPSRTCEKLVSVVSFKKVGVGQGRLDEAQHW